jgi:hypothetical protein
LKTEGRKEARSGWWQAADRVRCGEAYGSLPPPPSEFLKNTNPLYVQTGSREAGCLVKRRTSTPWPRRGRRGLRRRRGAFSHGGSRACGGQGLSRIAALLSSPGFEAPARTVGKYGRREERRCHGREGRAMVPRPRDLRPSHGRHQIVTPQPGAGGRGLVCRLGVPTPARSVGEQRTGIQDQE